MAFAAAAVVCGVGGSIDGGKDACSSDNAASLSGGGGTAAAPNFAELAVPCETTTANPAGAGGRSVTSTGASCRLLASGVASSAGGESEGDNEGDQSSLRFGVVV